jgi:hypothetical protein
VDILEFERGVTDKNLSVKYQYEIPVSENPGF